MQQPISNPTGTPGQPVLQAHLLGQVGYREFLALQRRLVFDTVCRAKRQITLLVCEHPAVITIGRRGSETDVKPRGVLLAGRQIDVLDDARGGGTVLAGPGQLAVYPIVPLDCFGWTVGAYLDRFQAGLLGALQSLGIHGKLRPGQHGVWGSSGQLVTMGVGVRDWVAHYGAQIQVAPPPPLAKYITTDPWQHSRLGSLSAELRRAMRMTKIRSRIVRQMAEALDCQRYHLFTGHPWLERSTTNARKVAYAS